MVTYAHFTCIKNIKYQSMMNKYVLNFTKSALFLLLFIVCNALSAQTTAIKLDSLTINMRDVKHESKPAISRDSVHFQNWVEVSIQFNIKGVSNLKTVELTFEKTKGARDFKTFTLNYLKDASGRYLSFKGKRFPIKNSWVTISQTLPKKLLNHKVYLSIQALDKASVASNTLTLTVN